MGRDCGKVQVALRLSDDGRLVELWGKTQILRGTMPFVPLPLHVPTPSPHPFHSMSPLHTPSSLPVPVSPEVHEVFCVVMPET